MKKGYLSQYFDGVAVKRLSAVEVDIITSNQHEFNGVSPLKNILGEPVGRVVYPARFISITDSEDETQFKDGSLTWYDARERGRLAGNADRSEYRLYFPTDFIFNTATVGDLLVIAKKSDGTLLAIIAKNGTTVENQIMWLFGFAELKNKGFSVNAKLESENEKIGFAARLVLEQIGIEPEDEEPKYLDLILEKFGGDFPKTIDFSAYARSTIQGLSSHDDPDFALMAWMEREELLFRTLEKHLMGQKLRQLINDGVDDPEPFIKLVQSALQRRKSRAGSAFENHLEVVFGERNVRYTRTGVTERKLKPDFIFPSIENYRNPSFHDRYLTMLAVKSTCKDRWRQILNEAARIPKKHLITLEPGISGNQTDEMREEGVTLVLPKILHSSYTQKQQAEIMTVLGFVTMAKERQSHSDRQI